MAKYKINYYDKKGKVLKSSFENLPTMEKYWDKSVKLDRRDGLITGFVAPLDKKGKRKVTLVSGTYKNGERVTATLVSSEKKSSAVRGPNKGGSRK